MADINQYMEWAKHRATLEEITTDESKHLHIITSSHPSSQEFQQTQSKIVSIQNYLQQSKNERKTFFQQERIEAATHTIEQLLPSLHQRFLSYYNLGKNIPKTLIIWNEQQNTEKKQHYLELIINQCQIYHHTSFFQQTIIPYSYTLNTFYNDLALLTQENNTLLPEYTSIEHVSELYLFRKKVESIIQDKKQEQLIKKYHLSNSSVEVKVIKEISQKYNQSIQQDIETIFKNLPLYFSEQKKIKKEIEKIELITTRIIGTPIQLSEKYISSLCATSIEEKTFNDLGAIYIKRNIALYNNSKNTQKKAISSKKHEISLLIENRKNDISSKLEQATPIEIKQYVSEIKQLQQYASLIDNKYLTDNLTSLDIKIDRYHRFYEATSAATQDSNQKTNTIHENKIKTDATDKEPIKYSATSIQPKIIEQYGNKTISTEKIILPPIKKIANLLDFAYQSSQQTTDKKFQEFCIALAGYDGKRYSTIPLSTRLQQAKDYDLKGLTGKDQQIYNHIIKSI